MIIYIHRKWWSLWWTNLTQQVIIMIIYSPKKMIIMVNEPDTARKSSIVVMSSTASVNKSTWCIHASLNSNKFSRAALLLVRSESVHAACKTWNRKSILENLGLIFKSSLHTKVLINYLRTELLQLLGGHLHKLHTFHIGRDWTC